VPISPIVASQLAGPASNMRARPNWPADHTVQSTFQLACGLKREANSPSSSNISQLIGPRAKGAISSSLRKSSNVHSLFSSATAYRTRQAFAPSPAGCRGEQECECIFHGSNVPFMARSEKDKLNKKKAARNGSRGRKSVFRIWTSGIALEEMCDSIVAGVGRTEGVCLSLVSKE